MILKINDLHSMFAVCCHLQSSSCYQVLDRNQEVNDAGRDGHAGGYRWQGGCHGYLIVFASIEMRQFHNKS